MRYLIFAALAVSPLLVPIAVQAHGVPVSISINSSDQLYAEDAVTYEEHESDVAPFPTGSPTILRGTIGFYPKFGVVPAGTALTVDASGSPEHPTALLYWDGSDVLPAPSNLLLTRTGLTMDISPTDTFLAGGTLPAYNGNEGGHSSLTASLPLDSPVGLYGVGFKVSAPGYGESDTFWAILNHGVTDPAQVEAGLAAISAAVPEPGSLALAACAGLLGLTALGLRRR